MSKILTFMGSTSIISEWNGSVTKSQKGKKTYVEMQVWECFQWKVHGQCSKGDSCSFSHDKLVQGDLYGGQRGKGRSSSPAPSSKAKADEGGEQSSKTSGEVEECSSDKRSEFRSVAKIVKQPSCKFWHFVFHNYKSETGCIYGRSCFFRHFGAEEKPSKKPKKVGAKGSVVLLRESKQLGCASQDSYPRKSMQREERNLGSRHAIKFSKGTWHQIKSGKKGSTARNYPKVCLMSMVFARANSRWGDLASLSKNVLRERCLCAPKFEERSHEETSHQEGCARRVAWDLAKHIYKVKNADKAAFLYSYWCKGNASTHFEQTRGARIRSWFRSIDAHDEKKRIKLRCIGYFEKIQELHCGAYSQWRSAYKRGSIGSRSRWKSVRDIAITWRNACCSIVWKTLRRPRIFLWVGVRSVRRKWNQNQGSTVFILNS